MKDLNELKIGIQIFNTIICCMLYADDLVLIACNEIDMQKLLNYLGNWCKKWRVKINFDKSSVIHFRNAKKGKVNILLTLVLINLVMFHVINILG